MSSRVGRWMVSWAALFTAIALARILLSYKTTSQGFDEPCHVAAGIELIDKGTYTLDDVHPPLSRWAIGLPVYFAGERLPKTGPGATSGDYNVVGNSILYDSGHHQRDLILARLGVLPFFLFAVCIVFFWARREFGNLGSIMAVALFTTLPIVLAFSSIAYSDMAAASTQAAAFLAFVLWVEKKTTRSSAILGIALGLAVSAKFTTLVYVPAGAAAICLVKWLFGQRARAVHRPSLAQLTRQLALAALIVLGMLWGSYRFARGHVREEMHLSVDSLPTFQHFPAPVRTIAREVMLSDPVIPAPPLIKGLATVWELNHGAPPSYLFGHIKSGGWWYFFLAGILFKTPLAFLVLALAGILASWRAAREGQWTALAPAACVFAILIVTMSVKYDAGIRHVMVVFPLLAVVAGGGCSFLWKARQRGTGMARLALVGLLVWQTVATWQARSDTIAYFNELAGKDPSQIMVMGCDLDCGQDLDRLGAELRARKISHVTLALWSSADLGGTDLPHFEVAEPSKPAAGWFAISMRALRNGDVFHHTYPPDAFDWLRPYQPVTRVGKTILLYYIPDRDHATDSGSGRESSHNP